MKLAVSLQLKDGNLIQCINNIVEAVSKYWEVILLSHYTRHGVDHSERILVVLGNLLTKYSGLLNEHERFILIASSYLHDIGMQFPEYVGLRRKIFYSYSERDKVRNVHHTAGANIIRESIVNKNGIRLGLEDCKDYVDFIAEVSKYHRKLDIGHLSDITFQGEKIRLALLASLLRLGDALDVDFQRVNMEILKQWEIPVLSKFHWWSHYYVRSVSIKSNKIELCFRFPGQYRDNYLVEVFVKKMYENINNEFMGVYDILIKYGITLHRNIEVNDEFQFIDTLKCIPDDLHKYIKENIVNPTGVVQDLSQTSETYWFIDGAPYSDDADVVLNLSKIIKLADENQYLLALEVVEKCRSLTMAPKERMIFSGIAGICYSIVGKYDIAINYYNDTINISKREDITAIFNREAYSSRMTAYANLGYIYNIKGEKDFAQECIDKALSLARENGFIIGESILMGNLGFMELEQGNMDKALVLHTKSLNLNRQVNYRQGEAYSLRNLGHIYYCKGQLDEANAYTKEALNIDEESKHKQGIANDYGMIALIMTKKGDTETAMLYINKASEIYKDIGYRLGEVNLLGNVAVIHKNQGRLNEALALHEKNLENCIGIGYKRGQAIQLHGIGNILKAQGDFNNALKKYQLGAEISKDVKYIEGQIACIHEIAEIYRSQGKLDDALELCNSNLKTIGATGFNDFKANQLRTIGLINRDKGQLEEALKLFGESLELDKLHNDLIGQMYDFQNIGHIYQLLGHNDRALENLYAAVKVSNQIPSPPIAKTYTNLAVVYVQENDICQAFEYYLRAIDAAFGGEKLYCMNMLVTYLNMLLKAKEWNGLKNIYSVCERIGFKNQELVNFCRAIYDYACFKNTGDRTSLDRFKQYIEGAKNYFRDVIIKLFPI